MKRPYESVRTALIVPVLLTLAVSAAPAAGAQETEAAAKPERAEAIVELQHADPTDVAEVIEVFGAHAQPHEKLGLVTIRGLKEAVESAEAAARQLDRPPEPTRNISVTVYVLGASKVRSLEGSVPEGLSDVAEQLRQVFGFEGVELIDTLALRVLDHGAGQLTGTLRGSGYQGSTPYQFGVNEISVVPGERPSIRFDGVLFEAHTPSEGPSPPEGARVQRDLTRLITDLEIRTGQKAVVGKAASAAASEGLILVVEAEILE